MLHVTVASDGTEQWTRLVGGSGTNAFDDLAHNGGANDVLWATFTRSGSRRQTRLLGGASDEPADTLAAAPSGTAYAAGESAGPLHAQQYHGGPSDALLLSVDP